MTTQKPNAKYGWQICDDVQRFASNSSDMQWVPKSELEAAQKEIENLKECIVELRQNTKLAVSNRTIHAEDRLAKAVKVLNEIKEDESCSKRIKRIIDQTLKEIG